MLQACLLDQRLTSYLCFGLVKKMIPTYLPDLMVMINQFNVRDSGRRTIQIQKLNEHFIKKKPNPYASHHHPPRLTFIIIPSPHLPMYLHWRQPDYTKTGIAASIFDNLEVCVRVLVHISPLALTFPSNFFKQVKGRRAAPYVLFCSLLVPGGKWLFPPTVWRKFPVSVR